MNNIKLSLPPVKFQKVNSEIDCYGFTNILANELHLKRQPFSKGCWVHGWNHLPLKFKEQLVYYGHTQKYEDEFQFVGNLKEEKFLKSEGVQNAKAAGFPYLYTDWLNLNVHRKKNSLVVLPGHVIKNTLLVNNTDEIECNYIDKIISECSSFNFIIFCISANCAERGLWIKNLDKKGVPYIIGADARDVNALKRMRIIFDSFEYMTSNRLGSHFLYASYSGCKCSLWGDFDTLKTYSEPILDENPEMSSYLNNMLFSGQEKELYPFFNKHPTEALINKEWAKCEIGLENMLEISNLVRMLGWGDRKFQTKMKVSSIVETLSCFPGKMYRGIRKLQKFFNLLKFKS